jgi:hypothetical protein
MKASQAIAFEGEWDCAAEMLGLKLRTEGKH